MSNSDIDDDIRPFDASHTFTVDEAVAFMLGYEISSAHEENDIIYGLPELLYDLQEEADVNLGNAQFTRHEFKAEMDEDCTDDQQKLHDLEEAVTEKQATLDDAHRTVKLAEKIFITAQTRVGVDKKWQGI